MGARHVVTLGALGGCLAMLVLPGTARGDEKAACIEAHEHGQEVRLANRWVEAHRLFLVCAQPTCPALVVQDCTRWADELSQHLPSVVVSAKRRDGTDMDDVALFIDGAPYGSRLPVVPISLDPGEHVLRLERAGSSAVERRVTLHDGERDLPVEWRFDPPATSKTDSPRGPAPVAAYVATGIGVAATIASIALLGAGKVKEMDLASSPCGRSGTCTDGQVNPIRVDYVLSGTTAGVAAVAAVIAVWQFVAHASASRAPAPLAWSGSLEF